MDTFTSVKLEKIKSIAENNNRDIADNSLRLMSIDDKIADIKEEVRSTSDVIAQMQDNINILMQINLEMQKNILEQKTTNEEIMLTLDALRHSIQKIEKRDKVENHPLSRVM